ncbi:MAG: FecR family protein, partial [Candidatus Goldbacteria bacterium]|nr:FecR family protein [Candidatus Goldiibacteriota bacterium]
MNKIKTLLMVIGVIVLFAVYIFAQQSLLESVAVISDHSGTALILSGGKWKPAEINMPVYEGDAFRTKADSSLEITFDDATIIKLGPNTDLKLSEMKRNANIATTIFSLVKGKFLAIVDKLKTPDSKFEVHTKMAIAAVKGTEFAITADESETNLGVFEGSVEFKGKKGKVLVKTDNESKIRGDSHRKKDRVGIPDNPQKIIQMANFKIEIEKMREEINIIRELKQKGTKEVIQYRIKKKLQ